MGKMGAGKTLSMSILASYAAHAMRAPLHANYGLQGSSKILSLDDVWKADNGIVCLDEAWLTMDSRMWKDNVVLSRWINQTRKKKLIVFYTTQHIRQMELRARNATDILIYCEKTPDGHWLQFIDWQYRQLGRRYLIPHEVAKKFYKLYDTYEVLEPLSMKKNKRNSSNYSDDKW